MVKYILIYFLQVTFNVLKVHEIKYSYENRTWLLILNSVLINGVSLATTYFSLSLMLKGDWLVIVSYIIGSASGKWLATTKFFNYRNFIFNQLKLRKENTQSEAPRKEKSPVD